MTNVDKAKKIFAYNVAQLLDGKYGKYCEFRQATIVQIESKIRTQGNARSIAATLYNNIRKDSIKANPTLQQQLSR